MFILSRFRTEAHQDVVHRFNERFILSLASNNACVFLDDNLNILPLSSHVKSLEKVAGLCPVSDREEELAELKTNLQDTQPVGALVNQTRSVSSSPLSLSFWSFSSHGLFVERISQLKHYILVFSFHLKILLKWMRDEKF